MTSDARARGCYVYITLPDQTTPVTAGRFVLDRDRHGAAIGRFVYGRTYRDRPDAVELDPVELKLAPKTYETAGMGGVFGALRDAGPDYWGRRVIERHAGTARLRPWRRTASPSARLQSNTRSGEIAEDRGRPRAGGRGGGDTHRRTDRGTSPDWYIHGRRAAKSGRRG